MKGKEQEYKYISRILSISLAVLRQKVSTEAEQAETSETSATATFNKEKIWEKSDVSSQNRCNVPLRDLMHVHSTSVSVLMAVVRQVPQFGCSLNWREQGRSSQKCPNTLPTNHTKGRSGHPDTDSRFKREILLVSCLQPFRWLEQLSWTALKGKFGQK